MLKATVIKKKVTNALPSFFYFYKIYIYISCCKDENVSLFIFNYVLEQESKYTIQCAQSDLRNYFSSLEKENIAVSPPSRDTGNNCNLIG